MKKYINFLFLIVVVTSCATNNQFSKRKYLNLKHNKSAEQTEIVQPEKTAQKQDLLVYSEQSTNNQPDFSSSIQPQQFQSETTKGLKPFSTLKRKNTRVKKFSNRSSKKQKLKRVYEEDPNENEEPEEEENTMALTAFLVLCCSVFIPFAFLVSFILGLIALGQIKKEPNRYNNKWMAQVATWVSLGFMLLGIIIAVIIILAIIFV